MTRTDARRGHGSVPLSHSGNVVTRIILQTQRCQFDFDLPHTYMDGWMDGSLHNNEPIVILRKISQK